MVCSRGNVHVRIEKHKHTQATTHDKTKVLDMWHNVRGGIGHSHSKKKKDMAHRVGAYGGHGHIKSKNKK